MADTLPPLAPPSDWHNKLVKAGEGARPEAERARGTSGVKLLLNPGCERCMPFPIHPQMTTKKEKKKKNRYMQPNIKACSRTGVLVS